MDTKIVEWRREDMCARLRSASSFDVVVIGGGATGLGAAVDAASRGLSVALVDSQDFCAGTSSRSTKLIHGGVRHLSNPLQWPCIREALFERRLLLQNAPQLVRAQTFVVPCYSYLKAAGWGLGLGVYNLLSSGGRGLHGVAAVGRVNAMAQLPGIVRKGLKAAFAYSDAQFDDAGLGMALLRTAVHYGAVVLNHAAVTGFRSDGRRLTEVVVEDRFGGETLEISGRVILNCTGVWVDGLRRMVDVDVSPLVRVARGTHIVVDRSFLPTGNAMVVPAGRGGRALYCIPWQGRLVIGTTEVDQGQAPFDPQPTQDEVEFLMQRASRFFTRRVLREDVKASFAGLRPVLEARRAGLRAGSTANMTRTYAVVPEFGNMITVAGGSWTVYRAMAEMAMRTAQQMRLVPRRGCMTRSLPLLEPGRLELEELQRDLLEGGAGVGGALSDRLRRVVGMSVLTTGACTAQDVLYRRLRIGQLDAQLARELTPAVEAMVRDCRGRTAAQVRRRMKLTAGDFLVES